MAKSKKGENPHYRVVASFSSYEKAFAYKKNKIKHYEEKIKSFNFENDLDYKIKMQTLLRLFKEASIFEEYKRIRK